MKFTLALVVATIAIVGSDVPATTTTTTPKPQTFCFDNAVEACDVSGSNFDKCNAIFGGANDDTFIKLSKFASTNLKFSFKFLLMSTFYGNYLNNREGFEKLYRILSDIAWSDAQETIRYITKRGGTATVTTVAEQVDTCWKCDETTTDLNKNCAMRELNCLTSALDTERAIAQDAHELHKAVSDTGNNKYDPDVASFLENSFLHKYSDTIRNLAGHVTDLKFLLKHHNNHERTLSVFLLDEYLQEKLE